MDQTERKAIIKELTEHLKGTILSNKETLRLTEQLDELKLDYVNEEIFADHPDVVAARKAGELE